MWFKFTHTMKLFHTKKKRGKASNILVHYMVLFISASSFTDMGSNISVVYSNYLKLQWTSKVPTAPPNGHMVAFWALCNCQVTVIFNIFLVENQYLLFEKSVALQPMVFA